MSGDDQPHRAHDDIEKLTANRDAVRALDPKDSEARRRIRDYYLYALDIDSDEWYAYRHIRGTFDIDGELERKIDAFVPFDEKDTYSEEHSRANLKLLRRVAFQRYNFRLARLANVRLHKLGESRLWLRKDYALLRVALAMPLGVGFVYNLPREWIASISGGPQGWACFWWIPWMVCLLGCAALGWWLIYMNARDVIGGGPPCGKRAWSAFGIGAVWCGLYAGAAATYSSLFPTRYSFLGDWRATLLIIGAAFVFAVLAQFFFSKSGSIADPL